MIRNYKVSVKYENMFTEDCGKMIRFLPCIDIWWNDSFCLDLSWLIFSLEIWIDKKDGKI